MICNIPSLEKRQEYLAGVEKLRGKDAHVQLILDVKEAWKARRNNNGL